MLAARVARCGGPEAISVESIPIPVPQPNQVLVRMRMAGVNFIETYIRSGLYPRPLPLTLGGEGVGTVESSGSDVTGFAPGERVAFVGGDSYAGYAAVPAVKLVRVPSTVDDASACAVLTQGLTAHYLATSVYPLGPRDTCLVHAAAGGTGRLLTQIARVKGASVIAVVGSEAKVEEARSCGARDVIIDRDGTTFVERVRSLTDGRGVDVVYDGVGLSTYRGSMACLRKRGMLVLYGNASGAVPPMNPLDLMTAGSIFLTRPTLLDYIATPDEFSMRMRDLFEWMASRQLQLKIDSTFALKDAADAHRRLESRESQGKILLSIE
eukprot:gnl/Spiro4/22026_TR10830_c0_g1_i1.p1 gnl/Spiro4/22026_TR10830_c0_g1~~gnl/Spiro4/22026_TR10830_c0_g1_i1.p1  ORF type:complete len:338 (+),score=53.60 gnl/Spiro4/22026_TR10830_c0_g1_i1:43-1014(+)